MRRNPNIHWTSFPPDFIKPFYPEYRSDGYYVKANGAMVFLPLLFGVVVIGYLEKRRSERQTYMKSSSLVPQK